MHPAVPPSVEYALTDLGRSLLVPLKSLVDWSAAEHERVKAARFRFELVS